MYAYLETPNTFGTSPGSSMQYEIPLYVVPTSKESTNLRDRPRYGSPVGMVLRCVAVLAGEVEALMPRREYP